MIFFLLILESADSVRILENVFSELYVMTVFAHWKIMAAIVFCSKAQRFFKIKSNKNTLASLKRSKGLFWTPQNANHEYKQVLTIDLILK